MVASRQRMARSFNANPELSYTLPAEYYYQPQYFEREKHEIFFKTWQYVGHVADLQKPGDYIVGSIIDQRILVVRADDGSLKAYYNICSHRGHLLCKENGHAKRLVCPFHAWSFDLNGQLKTAPNSKNVRDFDFAEHSLVELRVEQFLNLVMVNLDPNAKPLRELVPGLHEEVSAFLPDLASFKHARTDSFPLDCNWKFVFDQLECYHCPTVHPEAALSVDFRRRETTEHEFYHHAVSYLDPRQDRDDLLLRSSNTDAFKDNHVWYLWPNYMLLGQPGPRNFALVDARVKGPESVEVLVHHFFPELPPAEESLRQMNALRDIVFPQDTAAIASQQNGVRCMGYRGGRLMVDKERSYLSEHTTHWFDQKIWQLHAAHDGE